MRHHGDTCRVGGLLLHIPFHLNPPLRIILELVHAQTFGGVHGHPTSARDIADNAIAWQGMATASEVDQNVVEPLHFDPIMTGLAWYRHDGFTFLLALLNHLWWQEAVHDLQGGDPTIPHRNHQVICRLEAKMRG